MKRLTSVLLILSITFFFSSCYIEKENMISKIPAITEIPTITKENVTGLKSLSENYVIENIKKANQLLADTNKKLLKSEKKDKKNILKTFVNDYKEIVGFYVDITSEKKVLKIKNELLGYYEDTVELSMNISNAINNIQEFTSLNDLSDEVIKSWDNLDGILDNLTDLANFID